jgi:8-oxo-dGTP pyrophosphatase MutT (NUDIX family)
MTGEASEVLLLRRARSGRWRLPKGHVDPGESVEEAAIREVAEEADVCTEVIATIGESTYSYYDAELPGHVEKTVHHLLMRAGPEQRVVVERPTFDAGDFFPLEHAAGMLHFSNEQEAVRQAAELIRRADRGS